MNSSSKGLIFVLLSSFCYALTGLVSKVLINIGLDPLTTVTLRNGGCCLIVGLGLLFFHRSDFRIERSHIKDFLIVGFFMFIYSAAYFFALVYLNFSIAVMLLYTYPSMVVIASVFIYKESLNKVIIAALLLTFCGLLLTLNIFSGAAGSLSLKGIILALSAAVGAAGFAIRVKKLTAEYHYGGGVINFYCFLMTVIGYCILLCFQPPSSLPTLWDLGQTFCAVVPYTLAMLFYAQGLKYLSPGKVGIVGSSEPAFGLILSLIFLGESISASQWLGACGILGAIVLIQVFGAKKEKKPEDILA